MTDTDRLDARLVAHREMLALIMRALDKDARKVIEKQLRVWKDEKQFPAKVSAEIDAIQLLISQGPLRR